MFFADDCVGPVAEEAVAKLEPGQVLVLENTRFHAGEELNDPAMAKQLAKLADIFVNDAFSTSHRAHASTAGIARFLPSFAGRLMQRELEALTAALEDPKRPVAAIVGGAKVADKIKVIERFLAPDSPRWQTRFWPRKVLRSAGRCKKRTCTRPRATF